MTFDQWGLGYTRTGRTLSVYYPSRNASGVMTYGAGWQFDPRPEISRGGIRAELFTPAR